MMKRSRGEGEEGDVEMANCLMLLSARDGSYHHHETSSQSFSGGRVFECKTCNRQFPSFQALGGHRASHKRARTSDEHHDRASNSPAQPKTHECAICGTEFAMGQALGGHMRRHRAELESSGSIVPVVKKPNGTKRLYLDLNMPPLEIDGDFLGIGFVGKVPMVH